MACGLVIAPPTVREPRLPGSPQSIIQGLRPTEDEGTQLTSLSELNELLSVSTEDTLAGFPTETFVPLLVSL
jgi:E3 ubiquitin-protein ligase TRIP12